MRHTASHLSPVLLHQTLHARAHRDLINFRAKALHEANVAVEVFPLVAPKQAFPMDFWNGVVHAADDGEGGAAFSDGVDTVYRLQARAPAAALG